MGVQFPESFVYTKAGFLLEIFPGGWGQRARSEHWGWPSWCIVRCPAFRAQLTEAPPLLKWLGGTSRPRRGPLFPGPVGSMGIVGSIQVGGRRRHAGDGY